MACARSRASVNLGCRAETLRGAQARFEPELNFLECIGLGLVLARPTNIPLGDLARFRDADALINLHIGDCALEGRAIRRRCRQSRGVLFHQGAIDLGPGRGFGSGGRLGHSRRAAHLGDIEFVKLREPGVKARQLCAELGIGFRFLEQTLVAGQRLAQLGHLHQGSPFLVVAAP